MRLEVETVGVAVGSNTGTIEIPNHRLSSISMKGAGSGPLDSAIFYMPSWTQLFEIRGGQGWLII